MLLHFNTILTPEDISSENMNLLLFIYKELQNDYFVLWHDYCILRGK
jgi:hypothetical protein